MPQFYWKGYSKTGEVLRGYARAQSEEALNQELLQQGIALIQCSRPWWRQLGRGGERVTQQDCIFFFEQLSLLLKSGVPMLESLRLCKNQSRQGFSDVVGDLEADVLRGCSLSEAMARHPEVFQSYQWHVVASGERVGKVGVLAEMLATLLRTRAEIKSKVVQAMLGPLMTLAFSFLITLGICMFVVPQFEFVLGSLGGQIPWLTRVVLRISSFVTSWGGVFILVIILVGGFALRFGLRNPKLQLMKDRLVLKIPLFSSLVLLSDQMLFFHTMAIFMRAGLPLSLALTSISGVVRNGLFRAALDQVGDRVIQGSSLIDAIRQYAKQYIEPPAQAMIAVGEQSGNLASMLESAQQLSKDLFARRVQVATTLVQPILMVVVGVIIAVIMVAIYLPIFSMGNQYSIF